MTGLHRFALKVCIACLSMGGPLARAEFISGSDGSDGLFHPLSSITVDLAQAAAAPWAAPSLDPGRGVYDSEQWAVVFKYAAVHIPAGVTVSFSNHPSGAPVVWLVQGDVVIEGVVNLDGMNGEAAGQGYAAPGPGGFAGGRKAYGDQPVSGGFGPGGASRTVEPSGGGGGYATQGQAIGGGGIYGAEMILPLIGGSGAAAGETGAGGAGGGAILIAANQLIHVGGASAINARGGVGEDPMGGGGSGGAVRLLADVISGAGAINALGGEAGDHGDGVGGDGRTRIEANLIQYAGLAAPSPTFGTPVFIFPPCNAPALRIIRIDDKFMPLDPRAAIDTIEIGVGNREVVLTVEARNVPLGALVQAKIKSEIGEALSFLSPPLRGTRGVSTTTIEVQLPQRRSEIFLSTTWAP